MQGQLCATLGGFTPCFLKWPRASPDLHAQATPLQPSSRRPCPHSVAQTGLSCWVGLGQAEEGVPLLMSGQAHPLPQPQGRWKNQGQSIRVETKLPHAVGSDNPGCLIQPPPPPVYNTLSPIQYIQPPRQVETQPTCAGSIFFGLLRQPWQTGSVWRSHRIAGA